MGNVRVKRDVSTADERDEAMNARWLARLSFVLMLAAVAVLIGFAELGGLIMVVIGVIATAIGIPLALIPLGSSRDRAPAGVTRMPLIVPLWASAT